MTRGREKSKENHREKRVTQEKREENASRAPQIGGDFFGFPNRVEAIQRS